MDKKIVIRALRIAIEDMEKRRQSYAFDSNLVNIMGLHDEYLLRQQKQYNLRTEAIEIVNSMIAGLLEDKENAENIRPIQFAFPEPKPDS